MMTDAFTSLVSSYSRWSVGTKHYWTETVRQVQGHCPIFMEMAVTSVSIFGFSSTVLILEYIFTILQNSNTTISLMLNIHCLPRGFLHSPHVPGYH
jgi:hypothetical protein